MRYLVFDVSEVLDKYDRHPLVYELLPELSVQSLITIATGVPAGPGGIDMILQNVLQRFYAPSHTVWDHIDQLEFLLENITADLEHAFVRQGLYQLVDKVPYFAKWLNYQTLILGVFDEAFGNAMGQGLVFGAMDSYFASLPLQLPSPD